MKVKNIAFSGFMAAIMLSMTGAANAAVEIASKAYVDAQKQAIDTALDTKANTSDVYTKTESDDKYLTEHQSLADYAKSADVAKTYETQTHATATYATKDEIPSLDGLATVEQLNTKANASDVYTKTESDAKYLTEHQSLADYAKSADVAKTYETQTHAAETYATKTDLTTLTGRVDTNESDIETLNSGADVTGSVANTATGIVTDYAIPRAGANCTAASGRCVLSVDTNSNFIWVDVTNPAE